MMKMDVRVGGVLHCDTPAVEVTDTYRKPIIGVDSGTNDLKGSPQVPTYCTGFSAAENPMYLTRSRYY